MRELPTEAEFEELKRKRDEATAAAVKAIAKEHGWDLSKVAYHASHAHGCYCACPEWISEDQCGSSVTCSRCGEIAMYHDI
jgi:hypothetical protein